MFEIHHRRWFDTPKDFVSIGEFDSAFLAGKARVVSGDLVVDMSTGKIVTDESWLFSWEKDDPNCFAQRAIAWQKQA